MRLSVSTKRTEIPNVYKMWYDEHLLMCAMFKSVHIIKSFGMKFYTYKYDSHSPDIYNPNKIRQIIHSFIQRASAIQMENK